jgi:hypothetical protein
MNVITLVHFEEWGTAFFAFGLGLGRLRSPRGGVLSHALQAGTFKVIRLVVVHIENVNLSRGEIWAAPPICVVRDYSTAMARVRPLGSVKFR